MKNQPENLSAHSCLWLRSRFVLRSINDNKCNCKSGYESDSHTRSLAQKRMLEAVLWCKRATDKSGSWQQPQKATFIVRTRLKQKEREEGEVVVECHATKKPEHIFGKSGPKCSHRTQKKSRQKANWREWVAHTTLRQKKDWHGKKGEKIW